MIKNIIESILSGNYNYEENIFIIALIIDVLFFIKAVIKSRYKENMNL